MGYSNFNSSPVFPSQVSYQLITLTANIVVTWPFSFSSGTIIANINDVTTSTNGYTITLPDATLASVGQTILFNNISANHSFDVLDNSGDFLATLDHGTVLYFYLTDTSTSAGLWELVPFGGGTTAITAFTAESSDNSITITNGVVPTDGTTINFQLPTSIYNLNNVATTGFPAITKTAPLTWASRSIIAGNNILITNGNGVADNPNISLNATITALTEVEVGNIELTGSAISVIDADTGLTISSNGTGNLNINGVLIDGDANVSSINDLTVNGVFLNSYTPKAWCTFTDTLVGTGNYITLRDKANIASVTGGEGQYTLTFTNALSNNYYGVLVTIGTTIITNGIPIVAYGFSISAAQTTTSCQIVVVDASGEFVQQASGITVQILSST